MPNETVNLPLTGAGDSTVEVAVDSTPSGVVQLFKLVVSADGVDTLVPVDLDGLFVQAIRRAEDPQDQILIASALGPGASVDLDCADVPLGKTGRLLAVDAGASVPIRADIQVINGTRINRSHVYALNGTKQWKAPTDVHIEVPGGTAHHFGIHVVNLSISQTADARITLYWDEV